MACHFMTGTRITMPIKFPWFVKQNPWPNMRRFNQKGLFGIILKQAG